MTALHNVPVDGRKKLLTIEEMLHARPQKPLASTRDRGWGGITLDHHRPYLKCAEVYPGLDHHLVCYHTAGSARLIQTRAGVTHNSVISAGISLIMPAGCESTWEGDTGASARLRVPTSLIALAAEQLGRTMMPAVEIRNEFAVRDAVFERLSMALLAEIDMKPHPAQLLIVESISIALAAHMLRQYNVFEVCEHLREPSLSKDELGRLVAYVEDNLDRAITLSELADVVNVSRFHFTRLFKRSTGSTAIRFVEQCRIRRAQSLISDTYLPLVDIALMTGFADQSHFTRVFAAAVRVTPGIWRKTRR